jgi:hypothetical protein
MQSMMRASPAAVALGQTMQKRSVHTCGRLSDLVIEIQGSIGNLRDSHTSSAIAEIDQG